MDRSPVKVFTYPICATTADIYIITGPPIQFTIFVRAGNAFQAKNAPKDPLSLSHSLMFY